jgi:hypothetical protein
MKMIRSTRRTSMRGVTLISEAMCPVLLPLFILITTSFVTQT